MYRQLLWALLLSVVALGCSGKDPEPVQVEGSLMNRKKENSNPEPQKKKNTQPTGKAGIRLPGK